MYVCIWYIYILFINIAILIICLYHILCAYYSYNIYIYHWIWNSIVIISTEKSEFFPSGHVTASSVPRCWRAHNSTNGFGASHGHHFFGPISNTTFRYIWRFWRFWVERKLTDHRNGDSPRLQAILELLELSVLSGFFLQTSDPACFAETTCLNHHKS